MTGTGPFLWLSKKGSPWGFAEVPAGGMCLSVFLFIRQGEKLLLGKYADSPEWERLAGLDADRRRIHGKGWTIPASHLKYGEDLREAARRVATEILGMPDLTLSQPRVETEVGEPARFPGMLHYDMWFFVEARVHEGFEVRVPPWYRELAFVDVEPLTAERYGRSHEDIVTRWLRAR